MKKILVIVILTFAFGCSDDATSPQEKLRQELFTYKRSVTVIDDNNQTSEALAVVEFEDNGEYTISLDNVNIEDGIYTVSQDTLIVVNNECKDIEGKYNYIFKDNGVEFIIIEDDCSNNFILNGFFYDYDYKLNEE